MLTMRDVIIQWAKDSHNKPKTMRQTKQGCAYLEIPYEPQNYAAGNLFMAALSIIYHLLPKDENENQDPSN